MTDETRAKVREAPPGLGRGLQNMLGLLMCRVLGWHKEPRVVGSDGMSLNGTCPRCGKHVMLDSQGNWF